MKILVLLCCGCGEKGTFPIESSLVKSERERGVENAEKHGWKIFNAPIEWNTVNVYPHCPKCVLIMESFKKEKVKSLRQG